MVKFLRGLFYASFSLTFIIISIILIALLLEVYIFEEVLCPCQP